MLNDIKAPPLNYGMPEGEPVVPTDRSALPPLAPSTAPDKRAVVYRSVEHAEPASDGQTVPIYDATTPNPLGVQQPPAHRDVLEGHPTLPRREPASAVTPVYRAARASHIRNGPAGEHPQMSTDVARAARRGDQADGGTYDYPTRWSLDSLWLSAVVILTVVGCVGYVAYRLFAS